MGSVRNRPTSRKRCAAVVAASSAWGCVLLCGFVALLLPAGSSGGKESPAQRTRGVRLLDPGDEMMPISPFPELKPGFVGPSDVPPPEPVRIAIAGGSSAFLSGLTQRAAPFEIVPVADNPDLVWDAESGNATAKGEVIAYAAAQSDLPAVIDRMALARGLAELATARPQAIQILGGGQIRRKGERIEIEVGNTQRRSLVLFDVSGDGRVQALYPLAGDERIVQSQTFRWTLQVREPFGTDLIVAVTAPQSMDALENGLKEISRRRSAGEVLKLIAMAAPSDALIGVAALFSSP
jgi:hypothetical protein